MNIVSHLFQKINLGKEGLNAGLNTGLPKLDMLTFGVQRRWFTTWAGDSGSGKSSLVLYTQVFKPFQQYMKNENLDIHFLLFSFEMSSEVLLAKLLSLYLYEEFGEIVSYSEILSLGVTLTDEHYKLIELSRPWLEKFVEITEIIDKPVTAKGLYAICKEWSKRFGKYVETETQGDYIKEDYIPNNSQQYLITVLDHVKLLSKSAGHTDKQEIDEACDYLIHFRNKCGFTINLVQQLNRNFKSMERRTNNFQLLQLDDLSDSSGPAQASEVVIGIFYPFREKMSKCEGYDVRQLKEKLKLIQVLKNRFGMSDKSLGTVFFGECGVWKELPLPQDINDYSLYQNA